MVRQRIPTIWRQGLAWAAICVLAGSTWALAGNDPIAKDAPALQHGLLWHNSGLPAVFPLQIKTEPGRDYHITLRAPDTDAPILAAYITGGRFFRVLVPPGQFHLHVAYGTQWQGGGVMFGQGPRTGQFDLDRILTFEIRGIGTKAGQIVDLRDIDTTGIAAAPVTRIGLCQSVRTTRKPAPNSRFGFDLATQLRLSGLLIAPLASTLRRDVFSQFCRLSR